MVRDNGIKKNLFASDIAFVPNKRRTRVRTPLYSGAAAHHGYITRLRAGLIRWAGRPSVSRFDWCSFVSPVPCGEKAQISTIGEFVTLRDLRIEVRNDPRACLRHAQQRSAFGLRFGLAKARVQRNHVYYIQTACQGREREAQTR